MRPGDGALVGFDRDRLPARACDTERDSSLSDYQECSVPGVERGGPLEVSIGTPTAPTGADVRPMMRLPLLALLVTIAGCGDASDAPSASASAPVAEGASDLVGTWALVERRDYPESVVASVNRIQDQAMTITDDGRIVARALVMDGSDGPFEVTSSMSYRVDGDQIRATPTGSSINGQAVPLGDAPQTEVYRWTIEGDRLLLRREAGTDVYRRAL